MCHFFGDIVWVGVAAVQILCDVGLLNLMALDLKVQYKPTHFLDHIEYLDILY